MIGSHQASTFLTSKSSTALAMVFTLLSAAGTSRSAWAQGSPPPTPNEGTVEEIVVYAQRVGERLQDVPIAVTALTTEAIERRGVQQTTDLVDLVPSLQINGTFSSVPKITIRGVGTNDFQQNVAAAVGTYVDEVYIGPATAQNLALFDLGAVEVLRGPQGTLYGKNSPAGAIKYYSANPTPDFAGGLKATFGGYNRQEFDGYISIPLGERGGVRVSATSRRRDGYWHNLFARDLGVGRDDGNFVDMWAARAKLVYDITDSIKFTGTVFGGVSRGDIPHRVPTGSFPGGGDAVGYVDPPGIDRGGSDRLSIDEVRSIGFSGKLDVEVGGLTLTSITGYGKINREADQDADFSPIDMIDNIYISRQSYFSQELQAARDWGAVRWIGGVHYYDERHSVTNHGRYFGCVSTGTCTPRITIPTILMLLDYDQRNKSYAAFSQVTWEATDKLSLTGGLRYTRERRSYEGSSTPLSTPVVFPGFPLYSPSRAWDDLSWRASADYKLSEDVLIYATASTGFRAGNWNGGAFQNFVQIENPVNPESLTTYEAGFKTDLLGKTLRLNGNVFFSDYKDLQVTVFRGSATVQENASSAKIRGAELEGTWQPDRHWRIQLALSALDTKYGTYRPSPTVDLTGNKLINAPDFSGSLLIEYAFDLGADLEARLAADGRYQTKVFYRPENDVGQKGYGIANLRASAGPRDDSWQISVFVRNLFDKRAAIDGGRIGAPFFIDTLLFNEPRMWGASLGARF